LILQERSSQPKLRDRGSDREYTCVAYTYIVFSDRHLNHEQPQTVARDVRILQITVADQPNQRLGGSTFFSVSVLIIEVERHCRYQDTTADIFAQDTMLVNIETLLLC
jgi:hypothetical protein